MSTWEDFCFKAYEIEYRLGVLRGNEATIEWWKKVKEYWNEHATDLAFQQQSVGYISHTASVSYNVQFTMVPTPMGKDSSGEGNLLTSLQLEADAAWTTGQEWAAGIGSYLVDICAPFIKPDAATMRSTIADFGAIRDRLVNTVPPHWNNLDVSGWIGTAHDSFSLFAQELTDQMQFYRDNLALAENWFTGACALISKLQNGIMPMMNKVSDELDSQLQMWAATQGWPQDIEPFSPGILKVLSVGDAILSFVPAYDEAKGRIEDVVSKTEHLASEFDIHPSLDLAAPFHVQTATDIYTTLTRTLEDDFARPFEAKLIEIGQHASSTRSQVEALERTGRFNPPVLKDPGSWRWEPDYSHST